MLKGLFFMRFILFCFCFFMVSYGFFPYKNICSKVEQVGMITTNDTIPVLKKKKSWTKREKPFYRNENINAVDTMVYYYNLHGKPVFHKIKYHPNSNIESFRFDSCRWYYDKNDSLVHQLCYSPRYGLDEIIMQRDTLGTLLRKEKHTKYTEEYTTYEYDSLNRQIYAVKKDERGRVKEEWTTQYIDTINRKIITYNYFRSGGFKKLKMIIDTIDYSEDGLVLRKADSSRYFYDTKISDNYRSKSNCKNCIKIIHKNEQGEIIQKISIVRPNDTIYHERVKFEILDDFTKKTIIKNGDTSSCFLKFKYNEYNMNTLFQFFDENRVLQLTTCKQYEYY